MRLTLLAAFGAGYVLGSRAGPQCYDQVRELAAGASGRLREAGMRQRLDDYGTRLERYAARPPRSRSPA